MARGLQPTLGQGIQTCRTQMPEMPRNAYNSTYFIDPGLLGIWRSTVDDKVQVVLGSQMNFGEAYPISASTFRRVAYTHTLMKKGTYK